MKYYRYLGQIAHPKQILHCHSNLLPEDSGDQKGHFVLYIDDSPREKTHFPTSCMKHPLYLDQLNHVKKELQIQPFYV